MNARTAGLNDEINYNNDIEKYEEYTEPPYEIKLPLNVFVKQRDVITKTETEEEGL